MVIAALADLHGYLPTIDDCDVALIAGDVIGAETVEQRMQQWHSFGHWLADLVGRGIIPIGVGGNHDFELQDYPDFARRLPWVYLEDSGITIPRSPKNDPGRYTGVTFWGTPWQPWFSGWAFNAPEFDTGEDFLREKFQQIPDGIDVLISHGPPAGFHDVVGRKHVGSIALNERIQQVMPKLCVYGHIHRPGVEQIGTCTLANVAVTKVVGNRYLFNEPPVYFNI